MVDLAIVIVSYNTREMLSDCLRALPAAAAGIDWQAFVVDNASTDGSVEMARRDFPLVEVIANDYNAGFTVANNTALAKTNARHVLILNPDTEAAPGSLSLMVRFLDSHPEAGACGPMLLNSDGSLQPNGRKFPSFLREFLAVTGLRRFAMRRYELALGYGREDFSELCEVDQVSGACLMVRGEVMKQVGMLDERFFMFYEEIEWCLRIKRAGWKVYYVPEARVTHHWMGSVKSDSKRMTAMLFKSELLYYKKTAGPLTVLGIKGVVALGLMKNAGLYTGVAVKRILRRCRVIR